MPHPLSSFVASLLPIRDAEGREVAFAGDSTDESPEDALVISLRVCAHDKDGSIGDILEQQFTLVGPRHAKHPALPEFLRASFAALPQIVREDGLMLPCWLFFPELLDDERPDLSRLADAAWRRDARVAAELGGRRESCAKIVGSERADGLVALFRPRWLLKSERVDEFDDLDEGADLTDLDFDVPPSRLGGHPDLPRGFVWPRLGGDALTFLAQVDLVNLPRLAGPDIDLLPDHGARRQHHPARPHRHPRRDRQGGVVPRLGRRQLHQRRRAVRRRRPDPGLKAPTVHVGAGDVADGEQKRDRAAVAGSSTAVPRPGV